MILKVPLIYSIIRRNVSALYITGDKANKNYAVLRPYLDLNAKLNNKHKLEQNVRHRKMTIDLNEMQLLWSMYLDVSKKKCDLEQKRKEIANSIRNVDPKGDESEALIRKFKIEGAMARNDLKTLKENSYALEDMFIHKFLDLPNDIHERTPVEANQIFVSHSDHQTINEAEHHLNKVDYVEYHDPFCYYLKSDAAKCDLNLPFYCMEMFRSFGFIPFSNPDFIRSILAEGAGVSVNDLLTIVEEDLENKLNLLHLAGSGSMLSFLGFVTKLLIYKNYLPLKFVSSGKKFSVPETSSTHNGLYTACQTTNVQLFGMTINESESLHQFDETLEQMIEFYKRLDRNFRVSYVTGDELTQAESLRAVFEIYSPYRRCFIPIGHLSSYGDYVSKRLLIAYKDDKQYKFPHLISGSIVDVTKLLAILLEAKGVFRTPKILENLK